MLKRIPLLLLSACFFCIATSAQNPVSSHELFATISHMDSVYFNAYNTCDLKTQADIYSDSIEFYHDASGLETSKDNLLKALKNNICGKVSREIVPGTLEVHPLPGYGAVEIAMHRFINHAEHDHVSPPSRFIVVWRLRGGKWQITRVISLHAGNE